MNDTKPNPATKAGFTPAKILAVEDEQPSRARETGESALKTNTGQQAGPHSNTPPSLLDAMKAWVQSRS